MMVIMYIEKSPEYYRKLNIESALSCIINPVQRTLGNYELNNPKIRPFREVKRSKKVLEGNVIREKTIIVKDRVGVDFMTNQPKYVTRTTTSFKGGEQ